MMNMFIIVLVSQVLLTIAILAVLWIMFDLELWMLAIEKAVSLRGNGAKEITIVTACVAADKRVVRLKEIISSSCPSARIEIVRSGDILGGVIFRLDQTIEDYSIMGRLDRLRGGG